MKLLRCLLLLNLGSLSCIIDIMFDDAIQSMCQSNNVINGCTSFTCSREIPSYSRAHLYSLRTSAGRPDYVGLDRLHQLGIMTYRGTRTGHHVRLRRERLNERARIYNDENILDELGHIRCVQSAFRARRRASLPSRVLYNRPNLRQNNTNDVNHGKNNNGR